MTDELLSKLKSTRRSIIIHALYDLQNTTNKNIDNIIIKKLIKLISHSDADIRQLAVTVAAIHYQLEEAYQVILSQVDTGSEKDQCVLSTMTAGLGTLVTRKKGYKEETSPVLARIVLNKTLDPELRGTAYLSLLRIHNKISVRDYAASSQDIEKIKYEFDWINSFLL